MAKIKDEGYVLYSDPRWNDTSPPEVIGHVEFTQEEQAEIDERTRKDGGVSWSNEFIESLTPEILGQMVKDGKLKPFKK